jgi:LPS-assembly protein
MGGQLSVARAKEFPSEVDSRRRAVDVTAQTRSYRLSPVLSVSEGIAARSAHYDGGLHQTTLALDTNLRYQRSPRLALDLGYLRRRSTGESPFEFDRVQIAREVRTGLDWTVSPIWRLSLLGRFDLDRERFRDADIIASRTAHCLVYTVTWRQVRKEFSVSVGLSQLPGE